MSEIGVGLVGYKFMGRAHSNAYRQAPHFFDVDPTPRMVAICGRDEASVKQAAENLGWEGYETDYEALIARPDIQLIDVSTPGDTHKDVVLAALKAGKHVICEKPWPTTWPRRARCWRRRRRPAPWRSSITTTAGFRPCNGPKADR